LSYEDGRDQEGLRIGTGTTLNIADHVLPLAYVGYFEVDGESAVVEGAERMLVHPLLLANFGKATRSANAYYMDLIMPNDIQREGTYAMRDRRSYSLGWWQATKATRAQGSLIGHIRCTHLYSSSG